MDIDSAKSIELYEEFSESMSIIIKNAHDLLLNDEDYTSIDASDYIYNEYLYWLQKKYLLTDDEISIFINISGDDLFDHIEAGFN